ncbi:hypothetical protein ACSMXN_04200 [Jatrophihabitans sp. DSM 45814]
MSGSTALPRMYTRGPRTRTTRLPRGLRAAWLTVGAAALEMTLGAAALELVAGAAGLELVLGAAALELVVGAAGLELVLGAAALELVAGAAALELVVVESGLELAVGGVSAWLATAVAVAAPVSSKPLTANTDRRRAVFETERVESFSLCTCFECSDESGVFQTEDCLLSS